MLAAATRILAMAKLSALSPSWSYRVRSVTQNCSPQRAKLSRHQGCFGTDASVLVKQQHTCKLYSAGGQRRFQVFSIWGTHHRQNASQQGWPHTSNPCRGFFTSSRQKEEEQDRSVEKQLSVCIQTLCLLMATASSQGALPPENV